MLVLSLKDEALDAVLELDENDTSKNNRVEIITATLEIIFPKYDAALEAFEVFKRPQNIKIRGSLNQFGKLLKKTKSSGTQMSDNLLAYQLLKFANLPKLHEQMVKGTITSLEYNNMKKQLKNVW